MAYWRVRLWGLELPFAAVYADHYVSAGSFLRPYIWLLSKKVHRVSASAIDPLSVAQK